MVLKKCAISTMTLALLVSGVVPVMANVDNENNIFESKVASNKPIINVSDKTLEKGDNFNPLEGVTAKDVKGNDLTRHVIVTHNNVDTNRGGVYKVGYAVLDSNGIRTDVEIKVTVKDGDKITKTEIIFDDIVVGRGSSFDAMKGVKAIDISGKDITQYVLVSGDNVDTSKVGKYVVKYTVLDTEGNRITETRTVEVKEGVQAEKSTEIIAKDLTIEKGSSFDPLYGVKAIDISGKDITQHVLVVENTVDTTRASIGTVKYLVLDTEGNRVYKTIKVTVKDGDKVSKTEILVNDKTLNVGDNFDPMKDVKAVDISGKDITQYVLVTKNTVDVNKPGSYDVTYLVLDTENVRVSKTIKVTVIGEVISTEDRVNEVIEKISKLDKIIEYTDGALVKEARIAYDALSDEEKSLVTNVNVLIKAEKVMGVMIENVKNVNELIDTLPEIITLENKNQVEEARKAYEKLTVSEKKGVSKYTLNILINAESKIRELESVKSVENVIAMIEGLNVNGDYFDSVAIRNARVAYDALTPDEKKLVTNVDKLIQAEKNIEDTLNRVHNVENLINALPENITLDNKSQVEEARKAYDGLNETEKKAISKYTLSILTSAEEKIKSLESAKEESVSIDIESMEEIIDIHMVDEK